jgi:NAD(P)H-quinone oxidoreductase subunit 4
VICGLAAVGVVLTPIYLLSMLREIFFGKERADLVSHSNLVDAEPREVYIIGCLLVPIIGIGLYPRLMTDSYRSSIEALVSRDVDAMERISRPTAPIIRSQPSVPALLQAPALPG